MSENVVNSVRRAEIWMCDMSLTKGSEQGGTKRPVIVLSNDIGNKFSPVVTVACITSQLHKSKLPTHIEISEEHGMIKKSVILTEQLRTIDKSRLMFKITTLDDEMMEKVDEALQISLGLIIPPAKPMVTFTPNIKKREAMAV
jgi:mRNA interferase MazF